jgi:hypothetical protein
MKRFDRGRHRAPDRPEEMRSSDPLGSSPRCHSRGTAGAAERWRSGRFTDVVQVPADRRGIGDERDDPHRCPTRRAGQRQRRKQALPATSTMALQRWLAIGQFQPALNALDATLQAGELVAIGGREREHAGHALFRSGQRGRSPVCPQNRAYGSVHGSSRKAYPPIDAKPMRELLLGTNSLSYHGDEPVVGVSLVHPSGV